MATRAFKNIDKVPEPTLRRLPWYLSSAKLMREEGEIYVSSTQISKRINIDASQIAKDLSYVAITGRTRVGYDIDLLIHVLEDFLGFTNLHKAYLFGVGSLGGALLHDHTAYLFECTDNFYEGVDELMDYVQHPYFTEQNVEKEKGIIAQEITDKMVDGGIRAVWNFTPFRIRVPENIVVQNTSLYAHLAVMFNRLNEVVNK